VKALRHTAPLALAFAAALAGCGAPASPFAEVRVDAAASGPTIPTTFAGLSLEYNLVTQDLANPVFRQLMKNLGGGILRIGGDSGDRTCWHPPGTTRPSWCQYPITPTTTRDLFAASEDTGWPVILGLNLGDYDPAATVTLLREGVLPVARTSDFAALEIGNEPDLYPRVPSFKPARLPTYTQTDQENEFLNYAGAIASMPGGSQLPLSGPAYGYPWLDRLAEFADAVEPELGSEWALMTVHLYSLGSCGVNDPPSVWTPRLLSADVSTALHTRTAAFAQAAAHAHRPLQIDEANSIGCSGGGVYGTSDRFAAALWGLDFLFAAAQAGAAGVNLHCYGQGAYAPINVDGGDVVHPRPLYYAMLLFAEEAQGRAMASTDVRSNARVLAYAVAEGHGVKVFLLNEDLASGGDVVVRPSVPMRSATLLMLAAPTLDDADHTLRGGAAIDPATGLIAPPARTEVAPENGVFHVALPVASVAVLTLSP
jgi:hypothetical protein